MIKAIAAAGLLYAAWTYYQAETDGEGLVIDTGADWTKALADQAGAVWDQLEGAVGFMNIGAMKNVDAAVLGNANVQAFLRVIRTGEGTADEAGYRRIFGGQLFNSFADHPRVKVKKGAWTSTAAGAYQFLSSTWDETARLMGLADFSPGNQDLAAVGRIAARGALNDVLTGRFDAAVRKCAWEWASLPASPYGQPVITWERARSVFASAGGFTQTA